MSMHRCYVYRASALVALELYMYGYLFCAYWNVIFGLDSVLGDP